MRVQAVGVVLLFGLLVGLMVPLEGAGAPPPEERGSAAVGPRPPTGPPPGQLKKTPSPTLPAVASASPPVHHGLPTRRATVEVPLPPTVPPQVRRRVLLPAIGADGRLLSG